MKQLALVVIAACGSRHDAMPRPATGPSAARTSGARTIGLPAGGPGIGFDDLQYSTRLHRVLVPAGRSGNLVLVEPTTEAATAIGGFSTAPEFDGGHDFGITSVADTGTLLAVTDRTSEELVLVDGKPVARVKLDGGPDYVRWIAATHEVWVTEPDKEQIEVFALDPPRRTAVIAVPGGPESLVVAGDRAYTNLWQGATVAIDVRTHAVGAAWPNGCDGSRGIEVDPAHDLVFVGCADGKATVLHDGRVIAQVAPVRGMDIIAWSPAKRHLYLAGASSADLAIVGVSSTGELAVVGRATGAAGGHCVTTDDAGHAYVCDPRNGRLVAVDDTF